MFLSWIFKRWLVELGEDANGGGISGASMDDLEVPPIVDDDEGGGDAINE